MKFRWRRHSAQVVDTVPAAPELSHDQIFDIVHRLMSEHFGSAGAWVVTKRTGADSDLIFQDFFTSSLSRDVAVALKPQSVAQPASPIASDWQPEPITVWADSPASVTAMVPAEENAKNDVRNQQTAATETTVERLVA